MLKTFRMLSLIEGASLITLICVAMPAKYYFGYFDILWNTGMVHGILWMVYLSLSLVVSHKEKWPVTFWVVTIFASVIPFACFFLDRKLRASLAMAKR